MTPANAPPAAPMQITVAPTQPSHWLLVFQIMSQVLLAETPLLLQVIPPKAGVGVVAGDVGLAALVAALEGAPAAPPT